MDIHFDCSFTLWLKVYAYGHSFSETNLFLQAEMLLNGFMDQLEVAIPFQ